MISGKLPGVFIVTVVFFISLFPPTSNSYPFNLETNSARNSVPPSSIKSRSPPQCGFTGNNDIYGLGIRIGIYTQTLAVWFANYFLLSQAQILRDSITIFSTGILVVAFLFALHASNTYAVEAFILLQVLSWSCIMGVRADSRYSSENVRSNSVRLAVREFIYCSCIALNVWFWWRGLDVLSPTPCGTYFMYIVKVDAYGWVRILAKVMTIMVLSYEIYWKGFVAVRAVVFWKRRKAREEFRRAIMIYLEEKEQPLEPTETTRSDSLNTLCSQTEMVTKDIKDGKNGSQTYGNDSESSQQNIDVGKTPIAYHRNPRKSILEEVYSGEQYLKHCISNCPTSSPMSHHTTFCNGRFKILLPWPYRSNPHYIVNEQTNPRTFPPYITCYLHPIVALFTFRLHSQALTLYAHLRRSRLMESRSGPYQMYAALTYPTKQLPSSSATSIASSVLLSTYSHQGPKEAWYYALHDLTVHVAVILQLELTIRWNRIGGLVGLGSVGQLIPFITGIVGLSLVLGRWLERQWHRYKREKSGIAKKLLLEAQSNPSRGFADVEVEEDFKVDGLERNVITGYIRWKEGYELWLKQGAQSSNGTQVTASQ